MQKNRVAFIADADSPSAKAIAKRLADLGMSLVLNSPSCGERIGQDVKALQDQGAKIQIVTSPLTSTQAVKGVLNEIIERFGRLDVLIHNIDVLQPTSIEACDESLYADLIDQNVKTAFLCTQIMGAQMAVHQHGKIIYVSSIHDEKPTGSSFPYALAKGAVKMLCKEAALDLGRDGVTVNLIEMGPVDGDNVKFASPISSVYEHYDHKIPSVVMGTYDDLAELVGFMAVFRSNFLNGADVRLDGGFTLHYMDHKMRETPVMEA